MDDFKIFFIRCINFSIIEGRKTRGISWFLIHTLECGRVLGGRKWKEIVLSGNGCDSDEYWVVFDKPNYWANTLGSGGQLCLTTLCDNWIASNRGKGPIQEDVENYLLEKLKHPKVICLRWDWFWTITGWQHNLKKLENRSFPMSDSTIRVDLPFVVHTRDALEDTYEIIKSERVGSRCGIMHSFSRFTGVGWSLLKEYFIFLGGDAFKKRRISRGLLKVAFGVRFW